MAASNLLTARKILSSLNMNEHGLLFSEQIPIHIRWTRRWCRHSWFCKGISSCNHECVFIKSSLCQCCCRLKLLIETTQSQLEVSWRCRICDARIDDPLIRGLSLTSRECVLCALFSMKPFFNVGVRAPRHAPPSCGHHTLVWLGAVLIERSPLCPLALRQKRRDDGGCV